MLFRLNRKIRDWGCVDLFPIFKVQNMVIKYAYESHQTIILPLCDDMNLYGRNDMAVTYDEGASYLMVN